MQGFVNSFNTTTVNFRKIYGLGKLTFDASKLGRVLVEIELRILSILFKQCLVTGEVSALKIPPSLFDRVNRPASESVEGLDWWPTAAL